NKNLNRNRDQEFIDKISQKEMILIWEEGWNILFNSK
ncbi:DUF1572 family protein, partial [Shouchella clausii]